jgi:von Willebrand factor type A domain/Aerotolerance regulator N-terminal
VTCASARAQHRSLVTSIDGSQPLAASLHRVKFVSVFGLAIALFAVLPYVAHRLRRRQTDAQVFPPTRLVPAASPKARKRSKLEDRGMLALRFIALALLALLAATPLVRCSRMSLARANGASVAVVLVVDDSLSMRAAAGTTETRFARAVRAGRELLSSAADGDSFAIVLAGAPPRIVVAPTTDVTRARIALDGLTVTDRATDLDAALALADSLLEKQLQPDKRLVLLSDLADGAVPPGGVAEPQPLGAKYTHLVAPLPELAVAVADCAITSAFRSGDEIRLQQRCSPGAVPRAAVAWAESRELARAASPTTAATESSELVIQLPAGTAQVELRVALVPGDAIASDDEAPVAVDVHPGVIATYTEQRDDSLVTGTTSVVDRALASLETSLVARTLTAVPDSVEEFDRYAAVVFDDPSGFTPEQRNYLSRFLESGGHVLIGLGPRAARAPIGYSFEPLLTPPLLWRDIQLAGLADSQLAMFGGAESGLATLGAKARIEVSPEVRDAFRVTATWSDGAPFLLKRSRGRGELWLTTLPFALDRSDFALRPGFLALLDAFVTQVALARAQTHGEVGDSWTLSAGAEVQRKDGPQLGPPLPVVADAKGVRTNPDYAGRYTLRQQQRVEQRVLFVPAREIDMRPRAVANAGAAQIGGAVARVPSDLSWLMAALLTLLIAMELAVRVWRTVRRVDADEVDAGGQKAVV